MSAWSNRIYALDLRAARNIYRSTGSTYHMRLLWETISYTGDGLLYGKNSREFGALKLMDYLTLCD